MYTRLTRFRIHVELEAPAYLGLGIILPINVSHAPADAWFSHTPPTCS